MSFGSFASSWLVWSDPSTGILQQNSGTWSGATMAVTLPASTSPSSTLALFVAGNTTLSTPAGWTLKESQVEDIGHYLFTCSGGSNSWNITTNAGVGTWYVVELGGSVYDVSSSVHNTSGSYGYDTPVLTPTAGHRLLLASVSSASTDGARTITSWTDTFLEVADICNLTAENPMQGVAVRDISADGVTGYMTAATYSQSVGTRSAIIAAFTL